MCGITGFIDHTHLLNEQDLRKASATLQHRGGNGNGFIFEQKGHYTLGLANERLATIDLSAKAAQPLTSSCGNYVITFNGTIYNYLELRESLIKYGVIFSTLSDTEVILESYKKWGNGAFERLDGAFAFVILDKKSNQLLIARDEIGTKPLYYYKHDGFYAFASEIKALLTYTNIAKDVNKNAIATFFKYGYFKGEETIYKGILKIKKGFLTIIDIHSGNSYDSPLRRKFQQKLPEPQVETELQIIDKIEELLTESILNRNLADASVGVLLSGGYDSATVAAILQKNQSKRIKTYTVGFEGESINEAPHARKIAEHLKTNHHEFNLDATTAKDILEKLPTIFEEPIGNSGAIPLLFIAEKAHTDVKILLSAEGGDELFGGYRTYAKAIKFNDFKDRKLPNPLKNIIFYLLKKNNPKTKAVIEADSLLNKYLEINACFTNKELQKLLNMEEAIVSKPDKKAYDIKDLLIYDLNNYLPNDPIYRSDKCFMSYGIDNRDALLKTELINYLKLLDPEWFIKDGEQKYLLKRITNKYIPAQLMDKPRKGFTIPLEKWLKTSFKPLVEFYLDPVQLNEHLLLNVAEVAKIKTAFAKNPNLYNAQKVWLILQFQMWYANWIKAS